MKNFTLRWKKTWCEDDVLVMRCRQRSGRKISCQNIRLKRRTNSEIQELSQKTLLLENVPFHVAAALCEDSAPFTPALLSTLCPFVLLLPCVTSEGAGLRLEALEELCSAPRAPDLCVQHKLEISSQSRCKSAPHLLYLPQITPFCMRSRYVSSTFGSDYKE